LPKNEPTWTPPEVRELIERALAEDAGAGDVTTESCIDADMQAEGRFIAREPMVVAGVELLPLIFPAVQNCGLIAADPGDVLAVAQGPARLLLTRERVALNFLQRLCGVATHARAFVNAVAGTRTRILDTRKTTPGLRYLEKMAAAAGGAVNHRMGLYDAVLIKNNHITMAGSISRAVERARSTGMPVEVEVRNMAEIDEAITAGAKRVLLDNFSPPAAADAVRHIGGRVETEISGGVTLNNVRDYANAGADFISSGAITHSARAVDINFRIHAL
jgi:nicotinate-nucleotide pyrophosphorylase (carboxylating)